MNNDTPNVLHGEKRRGIKPSARELRKIVVWSEVLGKPLARRRPRGR